MKRKKHTPEEIIRKMREAEIQLGSGVTIPEMCRKLEISEQTYHRWKKMYGGLTPRQFRRMKEMEKENTRLKKLVADQALEVSILKEVARGKF